MAASYTATDLSNARAALMTIVERGSAEVEINGRRVKYLEIDKLQALIDLIEADLNSATYGASHKISFAGVDD